MTTIASHLSAAELEARYETAADPAAKSHFHVIWLLSLNYGIEEVAELLSFSGSMGSAACQTLQQAWAGQSGRSPGAQ
jgi:hypothetical protein